MKRILNSISILLVFTTSSFCQVNLITFFNNLYDNFESQIKFNNHSAFNRFCINNDIDCSEDLNQYNYHFILFLHELLTSTSATDFATGGILQIPYLWHWTNPNPRHNITYLPDSVHLSTINPPEDFSNYQSYADIDRIPSLYLKELFSDKPQYFHEEFGYFFTFGWCSEREMAFNTLMSLLGFESKIKQSGIHVWSELLVSFLNTNGDNIILIAQVDNTFDTLYWQNPPDNFSVENWKQDLGDGTQIDWYNQKAHSSLQKNHVLEISVSDNVSDRINELVLNAVNE